MNKKIKSFPLASFFIAFFLIIVIALVFWLKMKSNNRLSKSVKYEEKISVGSPCNVSDLKSYGNGGEIADTKGLQCYMYDDLSNRIMQDGRWTYPSGQEAIRQGVWIYPNHLASPSFLGQASPSLFDIFPIKDLTKGWKVYNNKIGNYSFKIPGEWKIVPNSENENQIDIRQADYLVASITYYPNSKLEDSKEYQSVKEAPDDWLVPDASSDTFVLARNFKLNFSDALLVERMKNFDLGASPYDGTIYVAKGNSYFKIAYTDEQNLDLDFPLQVFIKTLQFK